MSDDELDLDADKLINQILEENNSNSNNQNLDNSQNQNNIINQNNLNNLNDNLQDNPKPKKPINKIINKRESDDEDKIDNQNVNILSNDDSNNENKIDKKEEEESEIKLTPSMKNSDLENLMITKNIYIRLSVIISCFYCIMATVLAMVFSITSQRVLTFNNNKNTKEGKKEQENGIITMNSIMIFILLFILFVCNLGMVLMILLGKDNVMAQFICTNLRWYFVGTQFTFGCLFFATIIWDIDLWTINVSLSLSMLIILFIAFYFSEIKQQKNMSRGTLLFVYGYISILFSFLSYITLYNIGYILMENAEFQVEDEESRNIIYTIVKIGTNAGETIVTIVFLTYYKDVFFACTAAFIECTVFVHRNFALEGENIALMVMVCTIFIGIGITIWKYRAKVLGIEEVPILKN